MRDILLPPGYYFETLAKNHPRAAFSCGQAKVDEWLHRQALQHQEKRLSVTKVLLDSSRRVAGFYTLATGQVDFGSLPAEIARKLPKRALPVAVLAWMGVAKHLQGQGLGQRLLAQALRDGHEAGKTFAFVAIILNCIDDKAKTFYSRWDFRELPGHPYRLYLSALQLADMMREK